MQETLDTLIKYGYIILFLYSLGGGMVAILAAGVLSASGKLDLALCISLAFVANVLGSSLLFILGKYFKKDLSTFLKKHARKFALARLKMRQYGVFLIFLQKFIYGLKTFIPMAAGLMRYNFASFFIINALASLVWAVGFGYLGFAFGELISGFVDDLGNYPFIMPLFLLALVLLLWFYLSKFSKKV